MRNKVSSLMILPLSVAISSVAQAQEEAGFFLGGFQVMPALGVSILEDDNVYQEATNTESDRLTVYAPSVSAVYDNGISGVSLNYSETIGRYKNETSEDFDRKDASIDLGWAMTDSHRFELGGTWGESQDDRIDTNDINAVETDEYKETGYSFRYILGSSSAPFTVSFTQEHDEVEYTNNESETQFNNFEEDASTLQLTWRTSPDLSFFVSGTIAEIDYALDNNDGSQPQATSDSEEKGFRVGSNWILSANTSVSLSAGENDRNFDNSSTGDTNNSAWNAAVSWSPISITTFNLSALKDQSESSNDSGSFVDTTSFTLDWQYSWTDKLASNVSYSDANSDYIDDVREDDTNSIRIGLTYQLNRWAGISVFNEEIEVDSNVSTYDRTLYGLELSIRP